MEPGYCCGIDFADSQRSYAVKCHDDHVCRCKTISCFDSGAVYYSLGCTADQGVKDTRDAAAGKEVDSKRMVFEQIKFPLLAFVFITIYIIAVDMIGFIIPSLLLRPA